MPGQRDINFTNVYQTAPLVVGSKTTFFKELPLAKGWYKFGLRFNNVVVIGTGAGPLSEGELLIIKQVLITTDKNEILCNLSGRALYRIANIKTGKAPIKDAIAAASATYSVNIPLLFTEKDFTRNQDTLVDSGRYRSVKIEIVYGTLADLFSAPGTATLAASVDLEIMNTPGILPATVQPIAYESLFANGPIDASIQQTLDLDKARDMAIKRLYIFTTTAGAAGVAFSGTPADTIINDFDILDQDKFYMRQRLWRQVLQDTLEEYLTSGVTIPGLSVIDFTRDNSLWSALYTGNKSILRLQWRNQAGVAGGSLVSVAVEAARALAK